MAVTVVLDKYSGGHDRGTETYENAHYVAVTDGHLIVSDANYTIALYAPGKWVEAFTDDNRATFPDSA